MKTFKFIPLVFLIIFSSCYKFNEWNDKRAFVGNWAIEEVIVTDFDANGDEINTISQTGSGFISMTKDELYFSSGITEIPSSGRWVVVREGKKDVLYFFVDTDLENDYWDEKVTVSKKSSKKMTWTYFNIDNTTGKLLSKKEYVFKKTGDSPEPEPTACSGITFSLPGETERHCLNIYAVTYSTESVYVDTAGQALPYEQLKLEFSNNASGTAYNFIRIIVNSNPNGEVTTGTYPYNSDVLNPFSSTSFFGFWDGGNSYSDLREWTSSSSSVEISSYSKNATSLTIVASINEVHLDEVLPSFNASTLTNVEIDFTYTF